jgi:hypothetical protein
MIPGFLAPQGPKNFFHETCLACSGSVYHSGPLVGVARKILAAGTKFRQTSMASHLGVRPECPVAATTKAEEDDDSGPPRGCCQYLWQQPPLKLRKTSMAGPLGGLLAEYQAVATTEAEDDVDGGPPEGCCRYLRQQSPSKLRKTLMAAPLRVCWWKSGSHHRS